MQRDLISAPLVPLAMRQALDCVLVCFDVRSQSSLFSSRARRVILVRQPIEDGIARSLSVGRRDRSIDVELRGGIGSVSFGAEGVGGAAARRAVLAPDAEHA
jgi:hypothetical protein